VSDTKFGLDFMLNCSFLSIVLAATILVAGIANPVPATVASLRAPWLAQIFLFVLLAYLFYHWSIPRAIAYGNMVKSAIDLYRRDLLKQVGYQDLPSNLDDESQLWALLSDRILYGKHPDRALTPFKSPPSASTIAKGTPANVPLELERGVLLPLQDDVMTVEVTVRNREPNVVVTEITLTDELPAGFSYVTDSAQTPSGPVMVAGTNPYRFQIGDLGPGDEVQLSYKIAVIAQTDEL
jgi:uncharacterized repeat protein (TIGR01451 family)